jgi:hypothetical protein
MILYGLRSVACLAFRGAARKCRGWMVGLERPKGLVYSHMDGSERDMVGVWRS